MNRNAKERIKVQNTDPLSSDTAGGTEFRLPVEPERFDKGGDGLYDGWNDRYCYDDGSEHPQYSDNGNIGGDLYL